LKRIRTIPLGNHDSPALVDEDDYAAVSTYSWCMSSTGHVVARVDGAVVLLGRLLLEPASELAVIHLNGDHLDFRRENLRMVDWSTMMQRQRKRAGTTSKYKGVQLHKKSGRWRAIIWRKELGRSVHLGYFEEEAEAARAYDVAALDYYGEEAWVNFE
jgi:hypothetical protein